MPDTPPKKRKRGRPKKEQAGGKAPDPTTLGVDDLAGAEAAAEAAMKAQGEAAADTPPGNADSQPRKPRRKRVSKQMTQQIEDGLAEILQIPAVPASLIGDEWMALHFTNQGRALANRIAIVSERNPVLRGWCERAIEGESVAVLLIGAVMYAAPPLMHFGIMPGAAMLGIPVLRREPEPAGPPAPETAPPSREPVDPQPYGGTPVEPEFQGGSENGEGPPTWQDAMIG